MLFGEVGWDGCGALDLGGLERPEWSEVGWGGVGRSWARLGRAVVELC